MLIPFLSQYSPAQDRKWLARFAEFLPEHTLQRHAEVAASAKTRVEVAIVAGPDPAQVLDYPNLKWVASTWAGVDSMLGAIPEHIGISRLVDPELSAKMGEAVLTAVLALHRQLPEYAAQQARREWRKLDYVKPAERTVGILGLGELGRASIDALRPRGFRLTGWSRTAKHLDGVACHRGAAGLREVLAKADMLVCLLPLTDETRGLLNAERLRVLPKGASVINYARGPILEERALLDALDRGHLRHAVLDVYDEEPLPREHPYWSHPRITVLPHVSALTDSRSAAELVAADIRRYFASGTTPAFVDRALGY